MRTTSDKTLRKKVYAFVYGPTGSGKTRLAMTMSQKQRGEDVAFVTAEESGTTSLATAGFTRCPVEVLSPTDDWDGIVQCGVDTIDEWAQSKDINAICLDGVSAICGYAVDVLSDGAGEKELGWDGWAQVLNGFRQLELAMNRASHAGKSCIITAWEEPATYEETVGGTSVKTPARPLLQGKAKVWLPGKADIIARMSSKHVTVTENGKAKKKWKGFLHCHGTDEYMAKTRWTLPDPVPADLAEILALVHGQRNAIVKSRKAEK